MEGARGPARRHDGAEAERRRPAAAAAARREQRRLAEDRNVDQADRRIAPRGAPRQLLRRAPRGDHGLGAVAPAEHARLGEPQRQRARDHDGLALLGFALLREGDVVERMVQRQRSAHQEPGHDARGKAREGRQRERRQNDHVLLEAAFERDRGAGGEHLEVAARDRDKAVGADVPGDDGHMRRRIDGPRDRRRGIDGGSRVEIVERNDSVRQIGAESAHLADIEDVGGDIHRQRAVIDRSDSPAHDQRRGADPLERGGAVGLTPEQRQGTGDQSGARPARRMPSNVKTASTGLAICMPTI